MKKLEQIARGEGVVIIGQITERGSLNELATGLLIHPHLALVPEMAIFPFLTRHNRQVKFPPFIVVEFCRMTSHVKANDEMDSLHNKGF